MKPIFHNDIEFIHFPPPKLKKATQWKWGERLLNHGELRLTNVLEYRKPNRGKPWQHDRYEDIGIEVHNGVRCETTSLTPVFVCCLATLAADSDQLLDIDPDYDTLVTVMDPLAFFQRIRDAVCSRAPTWASFMAGFIAYDKEGPAQQYFWGNNTFQKHNKYAYQREYRFAFHEPPAFSQVRPIAPVFQGGSYADLTIGDCSGLLIVERVRLPTSLRARHRSTHSDCPLPNQDYCRRYK